MLTLILMIAVGWIVLDIVLVGIWSLLCSRGERRRLAEGSLLLASYEPAPDEEAAILRARESL